jgi:DNA-binding transcriptional MocR family regulator
MISSLEKYFRHSDVTWTNPKGGLFLWVTMPNIDTTKLLPFAIEEGVLYIPGVAFQTDDENNLHLRLCYSYCGEEKIDEAIHRLYKAYTIYKNQ